MSLQLFAQGEETGPIMVNPQLVAKSLAGKPKSSYAKANPGTFDSTFIYSTDTVSLPFFDEFSTNKFQTYNASYSDPGVTFDKQYRLLDLSSTPLASDVLYTQQQTFKRSYDIANGTFVDTYFAPTSIQLGDMSNYPTSYATVDVYPPYYIYDTLDYPNPQDTIWIVGAEIYQDSATQFFAKVNNPNLLWLDNEAFHNYTMAKDPWTLGVVTFDGLDATGYPYAIGTVTSGYADHLTSKPIDMSGLSVADSVYLSFLYQPQGLCDEPEAGDSLYLEFYQQNTDQWNLIWKGGGTSVEDFKMGHFRIDSAIYFTDAFQFRFKNYGGLSGSLDHYHLDYVNLRASSGYQDTLFKDFAFSYPIKTLLKDYTSVPWDHYKNNFSGKMSDAVEIIVRNGSNIAENDNLNGSVEVSYAGTPEGNFTLLGPALSNFNGNYAPRTTYYSYHDFSTGYYYPETKPGIEEEWDITGVAQAQFPNFNGNDTCYAKQIFKNYYSYDDGTAELAYGPTGVQARLAIQYMPYQPDSLIGVMIHFVPSVNDVSDKLFLLKVWDDDNGIPGDSLYQDDIFFPRQPKYTYDRNIFAYYFFTDTMKVPVNGTFYIGWRQFDSDRLNVGLDKNIFTNDKTFYSIDNESSWVSSSIEGSVMIRPIFSTDMDVTLGINQNKSEPEIILYPNPSEGMVHIRTEAFNFQGVDVYDLQGKFLLFEESHNVDISDFESGMYLFKVRGTSRVYKILKQ